MKPIREQFSGFELDLLALWFAGSISGIELELSELLSSLDGGRYQLYTGIWNQLHPDGSNRK